MAEEQDVEYTFSDKYIKHTSTCGVFLTENLLSTVRRAQTSKRERKVPCNWVRQKREGERNWDGMSAPGRSCERGAATAHQEGPSLEERTAGTGRCGALTETAASLLQRANQRKTCKVRWYHPENSSQRLDQ